MAPVAKRNFCRRHDHGMSANRQSPSLGSNGDNEDDDDDEDMDESEHTTDRERGEIPPLESLKEPKEQETPKNTTSVSPSEEVKRKLEESNSSSREGAEKRTMVGKETTITATSDKRRKMWSNLLARRPRTKDPRNLSSWLNEVLTVSDLEFPIDQYGVDPAPRAAIYSIAVSENGRAPTTFDEDAVDSGKVNETRGAYANANDKRAVPMAQANPAKTNRKAKADSKVPKKVAKKAKAKKNLASSKPKAGGNGVPPQAMAVDHSNVMNDKGLPAEKLMDEKLKEDTTSSSSTGSQTNASNTIPLEAEQDGFVGSFADWRDRKKGKAFKKGPSSLRK
jgi:hypothetical protein